MNKTSRIYALFLIVTIALTVALVASLRSADAAGTRQRVTFRCDGEPSMGTEWAGDDDVLVRTPRGRWRCRPLDELLPRLYTGTYPDGHPVYGSNDVTDDDGGTGGGA